MQYAQHSEGQRCRTVSVCPEGTVNVGSVLHLLLEVNFVFGCSAYTDYRTKSVPRKFLQPLLMYNFCGLIYILHKERRYFRFVKICTGIEIT